ncbi:MAG TPA: MXAN_6640 family putative metalloprotease [Actinomycetes bacterium]|nr:MXAN_6640 family putative metalloprotease [Actinomycetes bacterium]
MKVLLGPAARGHGRPRRPAIAVLVAALAFSAVGAAAPTGPSAAPPAGPDNLDRLQSAVLLGRPNGGKTHFGRNMSWGAGAQRQTECHDVRPICVHWTPSGQHAPPDVDDDNNDVPDQVDRTLSAVAASWETIVGKLGFRRPLSDEHSPVNGGDDRFDVYLADTGSIGLGGYTSSDDPHLADGAKYRYRDVSAFVVLDNDFRAGQFGTGTAFDNLRVTAAHEFFHAVQLAYDFREDIWMKEGTAVWAEDEVFDSINLNRAFLQHSSLAAPATPLDFGRQSHQYGSWLFFRYLSERFGPKFIARVWRLADDSPDQVSGKELRTYSMAAVKRALRSQKRDFGNVFADFIRVNLRPARFYEEGSNYPVPFSPKVPLNAKGDDTKWLGIVLDHLSAAYVTFYPGPNAPPGRRLSVRIDGPPRGSGTEARVVVRLSDGKSKPHSVKLNKRGNGEIRVNFGRAEVTGVDVALINASARYHGCFKSDTSLSCRGRATDDDRHYNVRARVL